MVAEALRLRRPAVLDELLATYGRDIQAVAYLIVRDQADAEDIVVETLVSALEHGSSLREADALRAWLLRIATNKALSFRRHSARVVRLEVVPEMVSRTGVDSDSRIALLDGIATLPLQMRAALVLRYYADLGVDECAHALGKSPNTIKAQLQEALARLRVALGDDGPDGDARGTRAPRTTEARNA